MRILILNWRDIKNPSGGGAEILTHEIAKRWAASGHEVIHFSAMFRGARSKETIDGVHFIRKGSWWNVYFFAFIYYVFYLRNSTDVIIDEVHGLPFFSSLYAPKKTIALVCEIANKLFFTMFPYPIAILGRGLEKVYLILYKHVPAMVISPSTYNDLIVEGHDKNISILPMGLSIPENIKIASKEKIPTIVYLGRLNKQKGILDAVETFALIKKNIPDCQFWVIGSGEENFVLEVKKKIAEYALENTVKFFGFVSQKEKYALLSKAHILMVPSQQEGWGLIVHEAGIIGTPTVAYNVLGLRDTIENNKSGILVNPNPQDLAKNVIVLIKDKEKYNKMKKEAMQLAGKYTWENTAKVAWKFIERTKYKNK